MLNNIYNSSTIYRSFSYKGAKLAENISPANTKKTTTCCD